MVRAQVRLRDIVLPALSDEERIMNAISQARVGSAAAPTDDQSGKDSLDGWFNEGGHIPELGIAAASRQAAFREMVRLTGRKLQADFSSGLVGQHHNTFQHRSRVLRQLTAECRAMTND